MWWISFIPDALLRLFVHGIVALGLILTLGGSILNLIPVIKNYSRIIGLFGLPILCVGVFFEGGYGVEMSWRHRVEEMQAKIAESEAKAADANKNLSLALITRKSEIDASQKFIKDQLGKVATQIDAQCKVDPKAIELINQAAQGFKK